MAARGLVISNPITVEGRSLMFRGSIDPQELRSSLLFWDKLDFPDNNIISIGGSPDVEFLRSAGILTRTNISVRGGGAVEQMFLQAYLHAYKVLDEREPGAWSLGAGKNSVTFPERDLENGRGVLVRLYDAIPVPEKDVPLADILEFKERHKAELLALRHYLDAIYERIIKAGDGPIALNSETEALELAIADYIKAAKETKFKFLMVDWSANLNISAAVAAGLTAFTCGLSTPASLLASAAALHIAPSVSLKGKQESPTPFRYISSYGRRLF